MDAAVDQKPWTGRAAPPRPPAATASQAPDDRAPAGAVTWRKLMPIEFGLYEAHLLRLSGADRMARFDASTNDAGVRAYFRRLTWPQTRLIGCFVDGVLRGAVELQTFSHAGAAADAELALSVEREFQGLRLGEGLVRRGLLIARNRWIRRVVMLSSPSNRRLHRIAHRLGGQTSVDEAGVETLFTLDRPDAASVWQEWAEDGTAVVLWTVDRWSRAVSLRRWRTRA